MTTIPRLLLSVGAVLLVSACGKKGALIYPDMLVPEAPASVLALQIGSVVKLQFALPDKDRAGRPLQGVAGVKISKLVNDSAQKDVCRSCTADYHLFRTLYVDLLPADTKRYGSRLVLLDNDVSVGNRYSYSIIPFTADGVNGSASAVAEVSVGAPFSAPTVQIESFPTEIRLRMTAQPPLDGQFIGYNVYRFSVKNSRSYQPINSEPLKKNEYVDAQLERGVTYHYTVRTLIGREVGGFVESEESQEVEGMLEPI